VKFALNGTLRRDVGWSLLGQVLGYGLKALYFVVIARLLGVLQYGIVVGAFALVNLVAQYSRLGMGTVLLRYVSPNPNRFVTYWGNILMVTVTISGVLTLILRILATHVLDPASAAIIAFLAVGSCLCEEITISASQGFQALQRMRIAAALIQLTPMCRTFTAIGMLLDLHHATARQWAIASMSASAVATIVAVSVVTLLLGWPRFIPHLAWKHAGEGVEYAFASSTTSAYNDLDKTMLSHYGMSAANGIYGLAYRIIEIGTVPLASILIAAEPRLFQLAEYGPHETIVLGRRLLKHALLLSTVAALSMFILAPVIPLLAGHAFINAISALRWLCLIPIFRAVQWVTGSVLTSLGFQRYRTLTQITVVLLNFGLNVWLIPIYGWHGAAWASLATDGALGIMNWSVLQWCEDHLRTRQRKKVQLLAR
jgi:O-antigen/teichoic acid export membrane protein